MEIPKNIINRNRRYKLIKEYPSFILYQDKKTGVRETFHKSELGLIAEAKRSKMAFHRKNFW